MLERTRARSGLAEAVMMWSPVVERIVQPSSWSQQMGSSLMTCAARRCQALVDLMRCACVRGALLVTNSFPCGDPDA